MHELWEDIQKYHGYSDLEIKRIQYALKVIFGDISKLCILFLFFFAIGKTAEYWTSVFVLLTIRSFSGGIHMKHYWSCLLFSFLVFYVSACLLPMIPLPSYMIPLVICACDIIMYMIGPIPSTYRPVISEQAWKKFRLKTLVIITAYGLLALLFPYFRYFDIVVWTIVVQTLQLIITNFIQKGERYEKISTI